MKNAKQQEKKQKKQTNRWRRQKQAPAKKVRYFETQRRAQADPRLGVNGDTHRIELENQLDNLVQPVVINVATLEEWARGFIMKACEKGFLTLADLPEYPYFAYCYTVQTMQALITQTAQLTIRIPYAMLAACRALQAKDAPCANGTVSYTALVEQFAQPTVTHPVGYVPYGYLWNVGKPTNVLANVYFPIMDVTLPGYTDEQGARAFQRLCQILVEDDPTGPYRMVLTSDTTSMDKDVSAFAYARDSYEKVGLASAGVGPAAGITTTLNLEVPIFRPQFGALGVECNPDSQQQRFGNLHANCAGDATFLSAGQATWFTEDKWRMQRPPKIHPIDFNEFADVVGKWVAGIQQSYADDVLKDTGSPMSPAAITQLACPLTLQEMCLLLRNVLMQAFKNTQAGCHGVYPITPLSSEDNAFVPFIVSTSTCYLAPNDMSLPIPLIENIRSLTDRCIRRKGDDWEFFLPSLGIWNDERLNEADYQFIINGVPTASFKSSLALAKKKVVSSEGVSYVPLVETAVSYVDGSSSAGFLAINDPNALKKLTTLWEEWLRSGPATFSCPIGTLGTEAGINALVSINASRVCGTMPQAEKAELQRRERLQNTKFIVDERFEKQRSRGTRSISTVYDNQNVAIDIFQSKILATAYEQIQSIWILPCMRTRVDDLNVITPIRWGAIQGETFSNIRLNGDIGPTLNDLHSTYASKLIRGKLQPKTDWDELFSTLSARGRGGILSGLVGKFANMIIPGAGQVIEEVGGAIGI
jgi:hypothetical protein